MKNPLYININNISQKNSVHSPRLKQTENKFGLLTEFVLVYLLIPLLLFFKMIVFSKMNILFLLAIISLLLLCCDRNFDKKVFLRFHCTKNQLLTIFWRFGLSSAGILLLILIFSPNSFSLVPLNKPLPWIASSISYLSMSVIPQELLYRAYLFHRYRLLFKGKLLPIVISTLSFSFAHIVYENYFALGLTLIGGYFFSVTYQKSRSLIITVVEHFMYGMLIFSSGVGDIISG
jgi:membrane protease YdiL (CAAX protease family)